MLGIARGLALLISDAKPIAIENDAFINFGTSLVAGIPVSALIWVAASRTRVVLPEVPPYRALYLCPGRR